MKHFIQGILLGNTINFNVDGTSYKKTCPTEEQADAFFDAMLVAKNDPTDDNVEALMLHLNQTLRIAKANGLEYDLESGEVFMKGYSTPVPEMLVKVIEKFHEKGRDISNVENFWKLLMINPDKRVRESLFGFIGKHDFSITDNGYMVVYKAVELFDTKQDADLNTYIANCVYQVKKSWGTGLSKYAIYEADGTFNMTKEKTLKGWEAKNKEGVTRIGNLKNLVDHQKAKNVVDSTSPTYIPKYCTWGSFNGDLDKEKIQLGVPQVKDRSNVDSDPKTECSNGLHCGATKYVESFASDSSVILVCLVNPAHVVAVPDYDRSKMRVSEYYPFALAERKDGKIPIVEQPYFEDDYLAYEIDEVNRQIDAINNEEARVKVDVSAAEDDRNIEEVLKALKDRVVDITTVATV